MTSLLHLFTLLDLCMSSLRRGRANILCIVPILRDDPRRESETADGCAACNNAIKHVVVVVVVVVVVAAIDDDDDVDVDVDMYG